MYFQRRMLPQIDGLSFSPVKVFSILIFHLLIHLNKAESQVVGPHQPVVALVDDDVILPCHVEPAEDVTAQILEWTRSDLNPRFVHVWRSGQDLVNTRNPSYRGRTSLFINELKRGNISLKLSRVKLSDGGTYECSFPLMKKKSFVKLVVASDAATSPVISLSGIDRNRGGVVLQCESAGWYPEPELLWLDGEGNLLSAGPTETLRGPDDLYTVSSRVTVEKRHSNNITCRVQQRNTNQSRETHIHVPEDFFEIPSSSSSVIIGLAVSLALCIMLLILSAVVLLRRKKKHKNNRSTKDHTDSGDAEVPLRKTEGKKQNTSSSSIQTEKQTSCCPLTSRRKLEEEQQRREEAEKNLQNSKEKMIKSEIEKAEFIHKLTQTFLTLDSKLSESISQHTELQLETNTEIIKQQLQQWNKTTQKLKNPLEKNPHELQSEKKTEIINQLQQVKEASEDLKNQLENKNPEMMKSENDEIIQKLTDILPTLVSKAEKNNTEIINQLQQEKQTAEDLKKQLERKSRELSGNMSQAQKEKQKMEREMERLNTELDSTKQQLQQETKAAEDKNRELSGTISQAQEEKQKMESEMNTLRNELYSRNQQLEKSSKKEDMENRVKAPVGYKDQRRSQQTGDDEERTARGSGGFPSQHLHTTDTTQGRGSNDGQVGPLLPSQQQMNKLQKGDFILKEVNGSDNYICLRNSSSEDKMMTGWKLKLQNKDGKLFTYKFQESFTLKPGEGLTLHRFNATRGPYPDNTHLKWADMPSWCSRDKVTISLISNTKEEHQLM